MVLVYEAYQCMKVLVYSALSDVLSYKCTHICTPAAVLQHEYKQQSRVEVLKISPADEQLALTIDLFLFF
jgi:hypothetical protein